jgi:hypothetical protein
MNDDEAEDLKVVIMAHWKWILDLQASASATRSVFRKVAGLPDVPDEVKKIVLSYPAFYDEERERLLFEFEKTHPGLAAELDKDNGPQPP